MSAFTVGTVASRDIGRGVEVLLRCNIITPDYEDGAIGWVTSDEGFGGQVIPDDKFGVHFLFEQDRAATLVFIGDAGTTTTTVGAFPDVRTIRESYDDEDEGYDAADALVDARRDLFRDVVADQPVGTVLVIVDTESGAATGAALRIEDGWVSTTNSYEFTFDDPVNPTILAVPAEYDESIA
ncbi:hypothetical protein [Curtobacterium sp. MCBD17_030]|uniref:hypothetical protein n=1 Tax=Curtobacterium sp. MCBD17_030 TaxID=2175649 RepID=UPI000D98D1A6|nr:hypothetical protein [Curtobacterium sp. MCBD17_030]PYY32254.1 hypothetical protein DEI89_13590 [Curtobacterium sp. MCBD17_030]